MRKNADLSSYLKSINPIFSVFSCQFVVTEWVHSIIQGKNKTRSNQDRYLVVATPGIFLFKANNFLPGFFLERIFPFVSIIKIEVDPKYIKITKSKAPNNSDDCQLMFKTVNQVIIAAKIHSIREALFGDTGLPYEIKIDSTLENDFNRQKYTYHSTSKIIDIFLSYATLFDFQKLQSSKLDAVCPLLNQIQDNKTLELNSELISKPYLSSIAATLSIDNDIREVRVCDINLGAIQYQKFFISVLQRTKSVRRLIFIRVAFEDSDFLQLSLFMQSNSIFCGDEWIFDNCDFSKPDQTKFDLFFSSFKNYQHPIRILTFNHCHFSLMVFEKVIRDILFSNCFHSLEVLWITNIEYPDVVLSFLVQLISSDLLIKGQKLNTLSIIDCFIDLSDLFDKMVKLNPAFLSNKNNLIDFENDGFGLITANFSGNSFWSPVTDKLYIALNKRANLIFKKCTFSDESLASLFQALSLHKGSSLHLDFSGIVVSEKDWLIFRKEVMRDPSLLHIQTDKKGDQGVEDNSDTVPHISKFRPLCLNTLTELVWDNNIINSKNAQAFVNFLKEQPHLKALSINDCINPHSTMKRKSSLSAVSHSLNNDSSSSLIDTNNNSSSQRRKSGHFYFPRSSELEKSHSENLNGNSVNLEKEIEFIILCFIDFAKSSKLASFRIRSSSQLTCIGPQLFPLLDELLKSPKLRVLDIFGQNIGDINLSKVTNSIPNTLEELVFDCNSNSAQALLRVLEQIIRDSNSSSSNNMTDDSDVSERHVLSLKKVTFPDFDVKNLLSKLSISEKVEYQTKFEILKREYFKLFQPSDYIDSSYEQSLKYGSNGNCKKKNTNSTDICNNIELNYALSKIRQYQNFSQLDEEVENFDNENYESFFNDDNDNFIDNFKDEKSMKRKKIPSIAITLGTSNEQSFISLNDGENPSSSFTLNNEITDSILNECGLSDQKNDPMIAVMERFSFEFSLEALTQKIEAQSS
ncbi:hypothetical protein M9Y10_001887 [Tritrichomonas musculus]|uniref:Uncharacterized protein n=1 Tax=Tritrichomonas musculus TaxID=1915356 RepID=A0ABR2L9B0_9EUKA